MRFFFTHSAAQETLIPGNEVTLVIENEKSELVASKEDLGTEEGGEGTGIVFPSFVQS